jgi:site-specific DNA-methyltransferase (adenine-specific)
VNNNYRIYHGDGLSLLAKGVLTTACIFADPPDNIGLNYNGFSDRVDKSRYDGFLQYLLRLCLDSSPTTWISYNPKWTFNIGWIVSEMKLHRAFDARSLVQTFTFGQYNDSDFATNHRPLLRIRWPGIETNTDEIRVPSWRQLNGDKRAAQRERVPGDNFDFPRVTGNSKQRRKWCPTQLHEGLVERCILSSTKRGDCVFDPFAGTGTTLRVCKKHGRRCITADVDRESCERIAEEHGLKVEEA